MLTKRGNRMMVRQSITKSNHKKLAIYKLNKSLINMYAVELTS